MARPNRAQRRRKRERFLSLQRDRITEYDMRKRAREQVSLLGVSLVRKLSGLHPVTGTNAACIDSTRLKLMTPYKGCSTFGAWGVGTGPKPTPKAERGGERFSSSYFNGAEVVMPEPEPDDVTYRRERDKLWVETGLPIKGAKVVKRPKR